MPEFTVVQQKALDQLEAAFAVCGMYGVSFVSWEGTLYPYVKGPALTSQELGLVAENGSAAELFVNTADTIDYTG